MMNTGRQMMNTISKQLRFPEMYKEAVAVQIDLGRFTTAAKLQKEIGEMCEAENDLKAAMEAFQAAKPLPPSFYPPAKSEL